MADGERTPEIRPCIDIVARGKLESVGEPELLHDEDSVFAQEVYTWRFTKREDVFGELREAAVDTYRIDHALVWPQPIREDVLIVVGRRGTRTRFSTTLPIWQDERGRGFVPILHPDDLSERSRSMDWRPAALMAFAKPVAEDVRDGGGRRVVARLYLEDIPALMAAARGEDCWR